MPCKVSGSRIKASRINSEVKPSRARSPLKFSCDLGIVSGLYILINPYILVFLFSIFIVYLFSFFVVLGPRCKLCFVILESYYSCSCSCSRSLSHSCSYSYYEAQLSRVTSEVKPS